MLDLDFDNDVFMDASEDALASPTASILSQASSPVIRQSRCRTETIRASQSSMTNQYTHTRNKESVSAISLGSLDVEALLDACDLDALDWPALALAEEGNSSEEDEALNDPERTPRPAAQRFVPPTSPTPASRHGLLLAPVHVSPIKSSEQDTSTSITASIASASSFPAPPARGQISRELLSALQLTPPAHLAASSPPQDAHKRLSTPPVLPPKNYMSSAPMQRARSDSQAAGSKMLTALHSSVSSLRSTPLSTPPMSPDLATETISPLRCSVQSTSSQASSSTNSFRWSSSTDSTSYTAPSLGSSRSSTSTSRKGSIGADSFMSMSMSRNGSLSSLYGSSSPAIAESPLDEEAATDYMQYLPQEKPQWSEYIDQHFSSFEAPPVKPLTLPKRSPVSPQRSVKTNGSLSPPVTIRSRTSSAGSGQSTHTTSPAPAPAPTLKSKKSFANIFGIRKQSSIASLRTLHGGDAPPISPPRKSSLAPSKRS